MELLAVWRHNKPKTKKTTYAPDGWGYPPDPLEEMGIDWHNKPQFAHTIQISPGEDYIAPNAGDKSRIQVSTWEEMDCDEGDYIAPGAGWQATNSNLHTNTGKHVFLWLTWLRFVSTAVVVCTTLCNRKTRRKMEWVFVLLITGQVFSNLSQCQMGGHIHVPNYVCAIETNPQGSQSHHLGTGVSWVIHSRAHQSPVLYPYLYISQTKNMLKNKFKNNWLSIANKDVGSCKIMWCYGLSFVCYHRHTCLHNNSSWIVSWLAKARVGLGIALFVFLGCLNGRDVSLESSLQIIPSNLFLWKQTNWLIVIWMWFWCGKPSANARALLREANAKH